jgi:ubiquinone/menaquinone biosynthesis C-methylase UbiE
MDHTDHVNLLRPANLPTGGTYADFGAGSGAFTLALRELVGLDATIYAVDKHRASLNELESNHRARFQTTRNLILLTSDFSRSLNLPPLDGIVMANSLHFFKDKEKILKNVREFLKPTGALLIVEYNVDVGNMWVPYPFTFETFGKHIAHTGFSEPRLLAEAPSHFLKGFYSAIAFREEKMKFPHL